VVVFDRRMNVVDDLISNGACGAGRWFVFPRRAQADGVE
jgi:hypothetical protein